MRYVKCLPLWMGILLVCVACPGPPDEAQQASERLVSGCTATAWASALREAAAGQPKEHQVAFVDAVLAADGRQQGAPQCEARARHAQLLARAAVADRSALSQHLKGLSAAWWFDYGPVLTLTAQVTEHVSPQRFPDCFALLSTLTRHQSGGLASAWLTLGAHEPSPRPAACVIDALLLDLDASDKKALLHELTAFRLETSTQEQVRVIGMTADTPANERLNFLRVALDHQPLSDAAELVLRGVTTERTAVLQRLLRLRAAGISDGGFDLKNLPEAGERASVLAAAEHLQAYPYWLSTRSSCLLELPTATRVEVARVAARIIEKSHHWQPTEEICPLLRRLSALPSLAHEDSLVSASAHVARKWWLPVHCVVAGLSAYDAAHLDMLERAATTGFFWNSPTDEAAKCKQAEGVLSWVASMDAPQMGAALRRHEDLPRTLLGGLAGVPPQSYGAVVSAFASASPERYDYTEHLCHWLVGAVAQAPHDEIDQLAGMVSILGSTHNGADLRALAQRHDAAAFRSVSRAIAPLKDLWVAQEVPALVATALEHHDGRLVQSVGRLRQRCSGRTGLADTYAALAEAPPDALARVEALLVEANPRCEEMAAPVGGWLETIERERKAARVQALLLTRPHPAAFSEHDARLFVDHELRGAQPIDAEGLHLVVQALSGLNARKGAALAAVAQVSSADRLAVARMLALMTNTVTRDNLSHVALTLALMAPERRELAAVLVEKAHADQDVTAQPVDHIPIWLESLGEVASASDRAALAVALGYVGVDGRTPADVVRTVADGLRTMPDARRGYFLSAARRLIHVGFDARDKAAIFEQLCEIDTDDLDPFVRFCIAYNGGDAEHLSARAIEQALMRWRWGDRRRHERDMHQPQNVHQAVLVAKVAEHIRALQHMYPDPPDTQATLARLEAFIDERQRVTPRDNAAWVRRATHGRNAFEAALTVLRGPGLGGDFPPIDRNEPYPGTSGVADLTALMWHAVENYPHHGHNVPNGAEAVALDKDNLQTSFLNAMASILDRGGILCYEGKVQRLMQALDGYFFAAPQPAAAPTVAALLNMHGQAFAEGLEIRSAWRHKVCGQPEETAEEPTLEDVLALVGGLQTEFEVAWPNRDAPERRAAREALQAWLSVDHEQFTEALDAYWQAHPL